MLLWLFFSFLAMLRTRTKGSRKKNQQPRHDKLVSGKEGRTTAPLDAQPGAMCAEAPWELSFR